MQKNYFDKVHKWGILWNFGAILVLLMVPVIICLDLGAWPDAGALKVVMPKLMGLYWVTAIVEVITYVPLLGAGGAYLSFVTGNISNLKLPCGLKAMENAKVRANTEEGEVVSTIAIAVSAIVTTVVIAVGVLVFSPVLGSLTTGVFKPAFDYVLPALFGALAASYFAKYWKLCIAPLLVGVIVLVFSPAMGAGTLMFITIVAAVAGALVLFKAKKL
ncbi:MAG: hypothetical protein U0M02_06720 [Acutalibacteraceae bacterium]|nr:hypothetical protein [Acutalibacteraceae bacterium]